MYSIWTDYRLGDIPRYRLTRGGRPDVRIHEDILKSNTFIGRRSNDGSSVEYGGTGFFVRHPSDSDIGGRGHLVTCKHVVNQLHGLDVLFQVSLRTGGVRYIEIPSDSPYWFSHPTDPDIDVAVHPINYLGPEVDYRTIPTMLFITKEMEEEKKFGIGDEIFFAGLFSIKDGINNPIVRRGNIAVMPNGKTIPLTLIPGNPGKSINVEGYIVEARSYGGMSGSAVYIRPSVWLANSEGMPLTEKPFIGYGHEYFLGMSIGHLNIPKDSTFLHARDREREDIHRGLSIVIPSNHILEVLNHPELEAMRKHHDKKEKEERDKRDSAVTDSIFSEKNPKHREDFNLLLDKAVTGKKSKD